MNSAMGPIHHLWRSTGFRLAFYYGLLVTITMLATLAIIYLQTAGVMYQRMARQVSATAQHMTARFDEGGAEAVAADIERALADGQNSDNEIFLLTDRQGAKVAGNIDPIPGGVTGLANEAQRRVTLSGAGVMSYLVTRRLPDGSVLVVGSDLRDQATLESLVMRASATAGAVALVLLIGGVFLFKQELERTVEKMRHTLARIAAGELRERVELSGEKDEFALLSDDINKMLDRIELLMDGVRHVSDNIAHNLRTPLMHILVQLRTAEHDESSSPAQRQTIAMAIREIEDLATVFEKLLQIAEAEAGARRRHFEPVDLHTIAHDILEFYDAVAEAQGATLRHEPSDPTMVLGDRDLLAGAMANLVDNALKYGGAGAVVRIGTQATQEHALVTVQDNGPGIPGAQRGRLGTRFLRLDRSTPGHGLGLASVGAIVALHGGHMRFDDAAPGLIVKMEFPAHGP